MAYAMKLAKEYHKSPVIIANEIVEAIKRIPGAKSLDGIKRRVRAGMGRCQAGFCNPKVVEILSRELDISIKDVCKNDSGSSIKKVRL